MKLPRGRVGLATRLLPLERERRTYVLISLVDATGSGMFTPISVLYLTQVVGLGAAQAGFGIAVAGSVGLVATFAVGSLTDRYEARRLARLGFALAACGYLGLAAVRSFDAYLAVACFVGLSEALAKAARKMLAVGMAGPEGRVQLFAYERSTRNVGYGVGGLLATAALAGGSHRSYVVVLAANAATYVACASAMRRLPRVYPSASARLEGSYRIVVRNLSYVGLTAVSGVLWLNDTVLRVGMAIWIVDRTAAPAYLVGLLFTLNTVLVVALQVRASRGTGTLRGAARAYRRGAAALVVACGFFAAAAGLPTMLAAIVLVAATASLTVSELFLSAADWSASVELADDRARGRYLAFFSLGSGLQSAVGPAIVGGALAAGGRWTWGGLAVGFLAAGRAAHTLTARAAARRPGAAGRDEPVADAA